MLQMEQFFSVHILFAKNKNIMERITTCSTLPKKTLIYVSGEKLNNTVTFKDNVVFNVKIKQIQSSYITSTIKM